MIRRNFDTLVHRLVPWRLWADHRGVAALEFAFVFPLALGLYMGAVETSEVLTVSRKITNIASATSDLVAQEKVIDDAKIADIFAAASSMIVPYEDGPISIIVTSIVADPDDGTTTVDWSDSLNATARAAGSAITVPDGLVGPGESVIFTEISYQYDSIIGHLIQDGFILDDEFYAKPRRTLQIDRE